MSRGTINLTLPEYPVDMCMIAHAFIYCFIIFLNALFTLNSYLFSQQIFTINSNDSKYRLFKLTTSNNCLYNTRYIDTYLGFDPFLVSSIKKNFISVMFPFLRPLGSLRLRKREVVEFFDSVLNSAIKIRQEGKEVSISNSFNIYSTSSLNSMTISINSVRADGPVVKDIHLMWLPHYLAERLVNTGVPNVIGTTGGISLPFNDLSQKLSYELYLKDAADHIILHVTTCKSLHGSPPCSGPIVDNYRTEIHMTIVHVSIFDESIITCPRVTSYLWS